MRFVLELSEKECVVFAVGWGSVFYFLDLKTFAIGWTVMYFLCYFFLFTLVLGLFDMVHISGKSWIVFWSIIHAYSDSIIYNWFILYRIAVHLYVLMIGLSFLACFIDRRKQDEWENSLMKKTE